MPERLRQIRRAVSIEAAPALLNDEHDIIWRLVRDELTANTDELVIDSKVYARDLRKAVAAMLPDLKKKIIIYDNVDENLFEKYEVESQFQKALRRRVWLKSGGYIVIDEAEALVAIDVNSGKFVSKENQRETYVKTNIEAAETIAQQLRLRDIGGIIVIDFIDMKSREDRHNLERKFKSFLRSDRSKTTVAPLTEYGLLQMTRKRVRQSLSRSFFQECPYCEGHGRVLREAQIWKNIKYDILGLLKHDPKIKSVGITVHPRLREFVEKELLGAARMIANHRRVALNFIDDKEHHLEHYKVTKQE